MRNLIGHVLLFALLALNSCNTSTVSSKEELLQYINLNKESFIRKKRVNNFDLAVKYLPGQFFVLKELGSEGGHKKEKADSLMAFYNNSRTFLLTVSSDGSQMPADENVMFYKTEGIEEYKQRALEMNFTMEEYFTLKTERGEFKPVLCNLENTYSAVGHKNFMIVFADSDATSGLMDAKELDLVFEDEFFHTGINHFVFKKEQIDKVPALVF